VRDWGETLMNSAIERLLSLRVADIMRRETVTLSAGETMTDAARRFAQKQISGAPVVNEDRACVGVLSATDFVRREVRKERAPSTPQSNGEPFCNPAVLAIPAERRDERVDDFMTRDVRSVDANASLIDAARKMCDAHVHRLPVLDAGERVVGIISSLDIVAALIGAVEEQSNLGWKTRSKS